MPVVEITMRAGRTDDQVRALVSKVTNAVVETVGVTPDRVRVLVRELEATRIGVGGVTAADAEQG